MKDFFANERWLVVLERCQLIKNIWHQTRYLRWRRETNNVDLNPSVPHTNTRTWTQTHTHIHTHTHTHTHTLFLSYGVCNSFFFSVWENVIILSPAQKECWKSWVNKQAWFSIYNCTKKLITYSAHVFVYSTPSRSHRHQLWCIMMWRIPTAAQVFGES